MTNKLTVTNNDSNPPAIVVVCHAWYHEVIGGSFRVATELAETLAARGHRVCYLCGTGQSSPANPTVENGVELWRYPFPQAPSPSPRNLWQHVRRSRQLMQCIVREHPVACIHGHTPLQYRGATAAAGVSGIRKVFTVHSGFRHELETNWQGSRRSWGRRAALHVAGHVDAANLRRSDAVTFLSRFSKDLMSRRYPSLLKDKAVVTPGWVDPARFRPAHDKQQLRASLGQPWRADLPTFFTLRRLESRMGMEELVRAAGLLQAEGERFRLLIGGGGSLRNALQRQIDELGLGELVHLLGRVPDDRVADCFAAADCFVLPTGALECFGLIILEAYASGTPVIGTPVGAIPETMGHHAADWVTADTGAPAIAARMRAFLAGRLKADREQLARYAKRFSIDRGVERMRDVCFGKPMVPEADDVRAGTPEVEPEGSGAVAGCGSLPMESRV